MMTFAISIHWSTHIQLDAAQSKAKHIIDASGIITATLPVNSN